MCSSLVTLVTQVVRGWFEPETWGKVWGVLSMASRFGAFSANMILGTCLQNGLGWRTIFIISGAVLGTDVLVMPNMQREALTFVCI